MINIQFEGVEYSANASFVNERTGVFVRISNLQPAHELVNGFVDVEYFEHGTQVVLDPFINELFLAAVKHLKQA